MKIIDDELYLAKNEYISSVMIENDSLSILTFNLSADEMSTYNLLFDKLTKKIAMSLIDYYIMFNNEKDTMKLVSVFKKIGLDTQELELYTKLSI
jgi:hypothetical protein